MGRMTRTQPDPAEDLDELVKAAVTPGSTPEQVAERVRARRDVHAVTLRTGLVKTDPPMVELQVEFGAGPGQRQTRVHDLTLHPDGTVTWAAAHPA